MISSHSSTSDPQHENRSYTMTRQAWYALYQDVRTPAHGENLFPANKRSEIALLIAFQERKEARKRVMEKRHPSRL